MSSLTMLSHILKQYDGSSRELTSVSNVAVSDNSLLLQGTGVCIYGCEMKMSTPVLNEFCCTRIKPA